MATIIYGRRVVTFREFLRPCHLIVINVFQNIFAAIDCPPRELHAAKNRIQSLNFYWTLWDFEICQKWPKTLPELATMKYDDYHDGC